MSQGIHILVNPMNDKSIVVEGGGWLRSWRVPLLGNLVGNNISFEITANTTTKIKFHKMLNRDGI